MLSIVLPAYKEAENLKKILPEIHMVMNSAGFDYEVLVIDTMEPMDDTPQICQNNQVRYIARTGGNSYGDAIRTGIREANGQYLVFMDADGSHMPADIVRMNDIMQSGKYDLIIGSRYCKGGRTDNTLIPKLMSYVLNFSYSFVFGIQVQDMSDSFRMYKAQQLKALTLTCDHFDIVEEILIRLYYTFAPFSIFELPITFHKREFGKSKRNLIQFIFAYLVTMQRLYQVKQDCR